MAGLIFGTSGWSYKEWVGPFYQNTSKMFSYYTRFFNTAEINSTFYRYPSEATVYGLVRTSPKDFVFSAKLPRLITHEKNLDPELQVRNDLARFLELLEPLSARNKMGCILIQLPPSFSYKRDREKFEAFLEMLPDDFEFAAEFRHHSWMRDDVWKLLEKHNVAYCIVDEPLLPPEVHITADFAYFRWHGRNARPWYDYRYSEEQLQEWVPRVEMATKTVEKVYGYFNNHFHGYAVENCVEILEMLNAAKPEHHGIKERIKRHNAERKPLVRESRLEEFGFGLSKQGIEGLLLQLTDKRRLERGMEIKDEQVDIEESSEGMVTAKVRDYTVELNIGDRVLKHDCEDWRKGLGMKRLCKHVVKILLAIPKQRSGEILQDLVEQKEKWKFELEKTV